MGMTNLKKTCTASELLKRFCAPQNEKVQLLFISVKTKKLNAIGSGTKAEIAAHQRVLNAHSSNTPYTRLQGGGVDAVGTGVSHKQQRPEEIDECNF